MRGRSDRTREDRTGEHKTGDRQTGATAQKDRVGERQDWNDSMRSDRTVE